jgi:hypothetical protein
MQCPDQVRDQAGLAPTPDACGKQCFDSLVPKSDSFESFIRKIVSGTKPLPEIRPGSEMNHLNH